MKKQQQGSALIIVLVALAVLLLGAASLARVNSLSGAFAGNMASKDASRQAAEIGISTAFARLVAMTALDDNEGSWYFASDSGNAVPSDTLWPTAPAITAGVYEVRYLVERLCQGVMPVTDAARQCFVKELPAEGSAKAGTEAIESPPSMQFRISVRAQGPKGTSTLVQVLANK